MAQSPSKYSRTLSTIPAVQIGELFIGLKESDANEKGEEQTHKIKPANAPGETPAVKQDEGTRKSGRILSTPYKSSGETPAVKQDEGTRTSGRILSTPYNSSGETPAVKQDEGTLTSGRTLSIPYSSSGETPAVKQDEGTRNSGRILSTPYNSSVEPPGVNHETALRASYENLSSAYSSSGEGFAQISGGAYLSYQTTGGGIIICHWVRGNEAGIDGEILLKIIAKNPKDIPNYRLRKPENRVVIMKNVTKLFSPEKANSSSRGKYLDQLLKHFRIAQEIRGKITLMERISEHPFPSVEFFSFTLIGDSSWGEIEKIPVAEEIELGDKLHIAAVPSASSPHFERCLKEPQFLQNVKLLQGCTISFRKGDMK